MDIGKIKELSKILTKQTEKPKNNIIFGTVISSNENGVMVQLDGADDPIPVQTVTEVNPNDKVMIQFNDHVASILGNVSDKSITRTTAEGLINLFAHAAILYGDNENIVVEISDAVNITQNLGDSMRTCLVCSATVNSELYRLRLYPNGIQFYQESITNPANFTFRETTTPGVGEFFINGTDLRILNAKLIASSLKSLGDIDVSGNAGVSGNVVASGTIKSENGAVIANDCTAWNGGVSGGYISTGGRLALVSGSSSDYPNIVFVKNKNTNANTTLRANNTGSTTYTLTLPNSTGTLATTSSDKRLKENIKPSEVSGLDLINKIELKQFDWKPEGKEGAPHWKIGMIADELEELDENLVFGGGENEDGSMNVKGIDTTGMIAYLVKAVQELSAEVKALRGEQNVK